uniref:Uncharacterized protein n=1 Tax=Psorophora albipes TaxID=869069 RepID=T1D5R8_9DIPT
MLSLTIVVQGCLSLLFSCYFASECECLFDVCLSVCVAAALFCLLYRFSLSLTFLLSIRGLSLSLDGSVFALSSSIKIIEKKN